MLLLELAFELDVLLFELADQVTLEFDLFDHLHEVSIGLVGSLSLLFLLTLNLADGLDQTLDMLLVGLVLLLQRADDLLLSHQVVAVLLVVLLHLDEGSLEHVTVALQLHDVGLLLVGLLLEPVEVAEQVVHVALRVLLLLDSVKLLGLQARLVVLKLDGGAVKLALLALVLVHLKVEQVKVLLLLDVSSVELHADALLLVELLLLLCVVVLLLVKVTIHVLQAKVLLLDLLLLLSLGRFEAINLLVAIGNVLGELLLTGLECVGLALLVLLGANQRLDLDLVLLVLLLEGLELGLLLEELQLQLVGLLGELSLGRLCLGELFGLGAQLTLQLILLVDHLLDVVVSAD